MVKTLSMFWKYIKHSLKRSHNFGIFQEDQRKSSIEGKKICWNFRKGRCRFGHKCTYAHDSDVLASIQRQTESSELSESELTARLPTETASTSKKYDDSAVISSSGMHQSVKKKRPGLSDQITPSKKAMKFFDKVYESKWFKDLYYSTSMPRLVLKISYQICTRGILLLYSR